jgi:hemerythrin-like domain-containing protein
MKRHKALYPLSHHHHHALVRALEIRRAAERPAAERLEALREAGRTLVEFWKKNGRIHFREEEEVLLPACARHVDIASEPAFIRMLADHAAIRARLQQLEQALAANQTPEGLIIELGRMLHDHVRLEEEQVFARAEAILGEAGLQAIAPHLTQLHPAACETAPAAPPANE